MKRHEELSSPAAPTASDLDHVDISPNKTMGEVSMSRRAGSRVSAVILGTLLTGLLFVSTATQPATAGDAGPEMPLNFGTSIAAIDSHGHDVSIQQAKKPKKKQAAKKAAQKKKAAKAKKKKAVKKAAQCKTAKQKKTAKCKKPNTAPAKPAPANPDGLFRYFETEPVWGPTRWNPCVVVKWRYNPAKQDRANGLALAQNAVAKLGAANGITFQYLGLTSDAPESAFLGTGYHIRFTWDNRTSRFFNGAANDVKAVGIMRTAWGTGVGGRISPKEAIFGEIVINNSIPTDDTRTEVVMMHELGHVMNLDHVNSSAELMNPNYRYDSQPFWGPGDLRGLQSIGAAAGCLNPAIRGTI